MTLDRRNFLKRTGWVAAGLISGTGLAISQLFNTAPPIQAINTNGKHLIIDPDGENFMYRDGYIVMVDK